MKKSICKSCGVLKYLDENFLCFKCRVPLDELGELKKLVDDLAEKIEILERKAHFPGKNY